MFVGDGLAAVLAVVGIVAFADVVALVGIPVVVVSLVRVVHAHPHLHIVLDIYGHVVGVSSAGIHLTVVLVLCTVAMLDTLGIGELVPVDGAEKEAAVDRMGVEFGCWHWLLVLVNFQQRLPFFVPRG